MSMKSPIALAALASCFSAASHAASPPPVPENLQACSKLQDAGERVRCYDAQIAAMNAAAATSTPASVETATPPATSTPTTAAATPAAPTLRRSAPPPTAAATTPQQSAQAKFGQEFLPANARPAPPEQEVSLSSSITRLSLIGPAVYDISLSNGQVWRQEGSHTTAFFRVGDDVRIKKGLLGSYQMSTAAAGAKNWVRVTRIQ